MHNKLPTKIVAKKQTSKQDTLINLSYNGQKLLPYNIVIKER